MLPKWLDRLLPDIDIEGENLDRPHLAERYRDSDPEPVTAGR
jgi:RND superfamily putative drug exporter